MRNDRRKRSGKVLDAEKAAAVPASVPTTGGGGQSGFSPIRQNTLVQPFVPGLIQSPYGPSYLTRRSRPIPADAIQAISLGLQFDIKGYVIKGTSHTELLNEYNAGETLLSTNWYPAMRQRAKEQLQWKATPTALVAGSTVQDWMNIFFYAVANCGVLINMDRLYQVNQACSSLYTYLPGKVARVKRLWRRLQSVVAPRFLAIEALKRGLVFSESPDAPVHVVKWSECPLVVYGGAADYTDYANRSMYFCLSNDTYLTNLIDNIEKAVWALESAVTYDANMAADFIAIRDVMEMLSNSIPDLYGKFLPNDTDLPGLIVDPRLGDIIYRNALENYETKGASADEVSFFPVTKMTDFANKIPIVGRGSPDEDDFSLWMKAKCYTYNDSTAGLRYGAASNKFIGYGTVFPARHAGWATLGNWGQNYFYTREDGWVQDNLDSATDFGDGAGIRAWLNMHGVVTDHVYWPHVFANQLTTSLEWRFLDRIKVDYQFWMDEEDLGGNYASFLAKNLGLPYIG
jgi:hypothetical protein